MTAPPGAGFWDWSVRIHDAPQVAERLHKLQDRLGLNVNILLWCCWCAMRFAGPLPDLLLRKAIDLIAPWSRDVTGALRSARRYLKKPPAQAEPAAVAALRENLKVLELDAERVEQSMLERLAEEMLARSGEPANALREARRTLARYAGLAGVVRMEGFSTLLLDDLARAIFPAAPNEN